jgi:uncharacterized protein YecE (DUF72 family)
MEEFIGCSGYYYDHWKGRFYPDKLPKNQWLVFYSTHFNSVEINNTFYRMPQEKAVKNWYNITPPDFLFAVKGYRYITHIKKLITDDDLLRYLHEFQELAGLLKEKAGPLLWQLPPGFKSNPGRLDRFCMELSKDFIHVFEFRNESWFNEEIYGILEKYGCSLCIVSGPSSVPRVIKATHNTAYIRFHGEGSWYRDNYSNESLQEWKEALDETHAKRLFAYFNNDANAFAVYNGEYFASLYKQ